MDDIDTVSAFLWMIKDENASTLANYLAIVANLLQRYDMLTDSELDRVMGMVENSIAARAA